MISLLSKFKGKKVLITGHTGFIGSWVSMWLNHLGAKIIGVSEVIKGGGYRSLVNVGVNGGQEVPHLHFHLFGGEKIGKMVE